MSAVLVLAPGCSSAMCPDGFVMEAAGTCARASVDSGAGTGDGGLPLDATPFADAGMGDGAMLGDGCVALTETCNMRDDDCDGMTDEGVATTYYLDGDGDGYGDPMRSTVACSMPPGHVTSGTDCDDRDDEISPAATDTCDSLDNDCSGAPDDGFACSMGDSVVCRTSCGTMGRGTCTATCGAPTTCNPPAESCNRSDDDCDGAIDEGSQTLGDRVELGAGTSRVVTLPTATGFISFYGTSGGIRARPMDADGTPRDEITVLTGGRPDAFDVTIAGTNYAIVYRRGTVGSAFLMSRSTLAATTAVSAFTTFTTATSHIEIVASATRLAAIYSDASQLSVTSRAIPSFTGERTRSFYRASTQDFDAVVSGPRAYVAYIVSGSVVMLGSVDLADDAVTPGLALVTTAVEDRRSPAIFVADVGTGVPQLGVAYGELGSALTSRVYLALYDVAVSGAVTSRGTTRVLGSATSGGFSVPPSVVASDGVDLVWSGGRWIVSAFAAGAAGTSSWRFGEVNPAGAVLERTVESTASTNLSVSIAPGASGSVLFSGARSDGLTRAYLLDCGS